MHTARIAELLQPFLSSIPNPCHSESGQRPGEEPAVLSPTHLQHISTYIDLLTRWNVRINLTAIRNPEEIVTRHFGESLFAARHLFPKVDHEGKTEKNSSAHSAYSAVKSSARVADLGSGAGFPGIPIKLWAPHISLTLIESNQKKATFLRELTRALTLTDINIQNAPAESLPSSTFDVVTLRAVEHFANILPVAAALLARAGRLALLVSSSQLETIHAALPSFTWSAPVPLPQSQSRILLISRIDCPCYPLGGESPQRQSHPAPRTKLLTSGPMPHQFSRNEQDFPCIPPFKWNISTLDPLPVFPLEH